MWPLYIYADDNLVSVYKNCNKASLYFLCRFARLSPYNPGRGGASHVRWLSGQQQHCWWGTSIIHHTNRIHCAAFSFLSYALFLSHKKNSEPSTPNSSPTAAAPRAHTQRKRCRPSELPSKQNSKVKHTNQAKGVEQKTDDRQWPQVPARIKKKKTTMFLLSLINNNNCSSK